MKFVMGSHSESRISFTLNAFMYCTLTREAFSSQDAHPPRWLISFFPGSNFDALSSYYMIQYQTFRGVAQSMLSA